MTGGYYVADLSGQYARLEQQRKEVFIRFCALYHLPAGIFDLVESKRHLKYCTRWLQKNGYELARYPDGRLEFRHQGEVLESLEGWRTT